MNTQPFSQTGQMIDLYCAFDCMFLPCHMCIAERIHTLYFPECQGTSCSKQMRYLKFKWLQQGSNPQLFSSSCSHLNFRYCACFKQEFLDILATIECGFTLKCVCDMIRTYNQMRRTDKYWQYSSIIWPVWLNGWVFAYELSDCGFKSCCSHLNFRYCTCFKFRVPWNSDNYRMDSLWNPYVTW